MLYFSLTKGMLGILAERNLLFARMGGIFIPAGHRPAAEAPAGLCLKGRT
ncbi:MAG: hypothetical protein LBU62_01825 [Bacteroidales bacterium]|nr:hypothetical protein [Bacteroidales bacterium]